MISGYTNLLENLSLRSHLQERRTLTYSTVIEKEKQSKREIVITWVDLTNAFGSIPHPVLNSMFESLTILDDLHRVLIDILSDNIIYFAI
jgi:hypothetical protein